MHEAKTHLSRLVEAAAAGEEILIARAGKPLVRLVAVAASEGPRQLGALAGRVVERDDAWSPDPELDAVFYDGEVEPPRAERVGESPRKSVSARSRKKK